MREKPNLFTKKFSVEILLESVFIHIANGQIGVLVHDDTVLVDLLNLLEVNDIRTVDAHEIGGQMLLHLLH